MNWMLLVLHVLGLTATFPDSVTVRNFSFVTDEGDNVLAPNFDRRRLSDRFAASSSLARRLTLKFSAAEHHFEFEFHKSYPIFADDATVRIVGQVCSYALIVITNVAFRICIEVYSQYGHNTLFMRM